MSERRQRVLRAVFVVYAFVLFVATHKPGVDVNVVPGVRLDLFIHAGAFGLWTLLLGATGWLGDVGRTGRALVLAGVGTVYAMLDESTQAMPIFDRVFDLRDMAANVGGALLASAVGCLLFRLGRSETTSQREAASP